MFIYQKIIITQEIINNFKPTRLCIKKLAGRYYFCKSICKNIIKYNGSGNKWKNIIKKHGKENIKTLWVSDWYYHPQEIHDVALHFSIENDIVNSELWANIVPEWGIDFHTRKGTKDSEETKIKKSLSKQKEKSWNFGLKGEKNPNYGKKHSEETRIKKSLSLKKYCLNRPQSHNDNLSKALKGNLNIIACTTGYRNPGFKGYYISPSGQRYDSSRKAGKDYQKDKTTIITWAKNKKNGWSFEPKHKK